MSRWEYLSTPPFLTRYVLAAHYLKDLPFVVEVGGYKNCVADFLPSSVRVVTADPLCERRSEGNLVAHRKRIEEVDWSFLKGRRYGVAALGLDLCDAAASTDVLVGLMAESEVSVVETPEKFAPGMSQMAKIVERSGRQVHVKVLLDLKGNRLDLPADSFPPFYERLLMVLKDGSR